MVYYYYFSITWVRRDCQIQRRMWRRERRGEMFYYYYCSMTWVRRDCQIQRRMWRRERRERDGLFLLLQYDVGQERLLDLEKNVKGQRDGLLLLSQYDVSQERLRDLEKKVKKGEEREREMVQQRAWDRIQMENQVHGRTQYSIIRRGKS